jgi:hypothetical protein
MKYIYVIIFLFVSIIVYAQDTYKVGDTEYYNNKYYRNGNHQVKRNRENVKAFLKSKGLKKTPKGYEVDHIIPLSQGGTDSPANMQLLTKKRHLKKTKAERKRNLSKAKRTKINHKKLVE